MIKCDNCEKQNIDEAVFCANCGAVLHKGNEKTQKQDRNKKTVLTDKDIQKSDIDVDDVVLKAKKRMRIAVAAVIVIFLLAGTTVLIANPSLLKKSNSGSYSYVNDDYELENYDNTTEAQIKTYTVGSQTKSVLTVDGAFVGETLNINEESLFETSGYVSESQDVSSYSFTAPRSGAYRIEIENLMSDNRVNIQVYDSYGEKKDGSTSGHLNLYLVGGEAYDVQVHHYNADTEFSLRIYQQKPTVDISGSTEINDQISFESQQNIYMFTPTIDGRYRLDLTEVKADIRFKIIVKDNLENVVDSTTSSGLCVVLEKDKTYTVSVSQYSGIGSYKLNIGFQKKTNDITGYSVINDSIQYADQNNTYTLTPATDGKYHFELTEVNANNKFKLIVWDDLDNNLGETTSSKLTLNLAAGKTYRIQVRHYSGTGTYKMLVGTQQNSVDITGYNAITDSITYEDQENVYYYTPADSGEYSFTINLNNPDSTIILRIYDEFDYEILNTRSKEGSAVLESGKKYRIVVMQYSENTGYNLSFTINNN